jgi:chromate transporter
LLWSIGIVLALVTAFTQSELVVLVLAAGVLVWLVSAPPRWTQLRGKVPLVSMGLPLATLVLATPGTLWALFVFFVEAGAFVFGSGLAIVPFLYHGVVVEHHWLTNRQFVDAVAVAMLTPGPVVITSGFIGYLVAGLLGAMVAALGTFLPCYLIVVGAAPAFRRYGSVPGVAAFVRGVTAAAVGAIAGAVVVLGERAIVDIPTLLLAVGTAAVLWRTTRVPEPVLVLVAAGIGIVLFPLLHH